MSDSQRKPTELTAFNKGGKVVTNAAGIAYVVFLTPQPYNFEYVVTLTCHSGIGYGAYATDITQNGFTINSWDIGGAGAPAPNIVVHWICRSTYNE